MLRDMLRQELPEALVLWERRPRIRVPRMHPALAALAGIGAQWLSLSLVRGVLFVSASVTGIPAVRTFEATEIVSWVIASIVSFASAGRRGVLLLIALALAIEAVQLLLALPGVMLHCELSGRPDCADEPIELALRSWPVAVGVVLGLLMRRSASPGGRGHLALALGASAVVLTPLLTQLASVPFIGLVPTSSPARDLFDWITAARFAAAFGMGLVAGRFGDRPALAALLIGGAYLLPWFPFFRTFLIERPPAPFVFESMWQSLTPAMFALVALFGLVIGAVARTSAEARSGISRR